MAKDTITPLRAAGDEFKALRTTLDQAKDHLKPLMVAALKAGVPQREVVELSGYTRESVRNLARLNGIPPK